MTKSVGARDAAFLGKLPHGFDDSNPEDAIAIHVPSVRWALCASAERHTWVASMHVATQP